jgi:hypothetical protein
MADGVLYLLECRWIPASGSVGGEWTHFTRYGYVSKSSAERALRRHQTKYTGSEWRVSTYIKQDTAP